MLEQKLEYMHLNPLQNHWNLVANPNDYLFSSCAFYEKNDLHFNWLTETDRIFKHTTFWWGHQQVRKFILHYGKSQRLHLI